VREIGREGDMRERDLEKETEMERPTVHAATCPLFFLQGCVCEERER